MNRPQMRQPRLDKETWRPLLGLAIILFLSQANFMASGAVTPASSNDDTTSLGGILDGEASIKVIGPLHLSEGKLQIKNNRIAVFSDAKDPPEEAELTGSIISVVAGDSRNAGSVKAIVIFTAGYSLPALYNLHIPESIRCSDGTSRDGRIVDATPTMLRIKTAQGVKAIPTRYVTAVTSPRAYTLSLPVAVESVSGQTLSPRQSTAPDASSSTPGKALVGFAPTYLCDPNKSNAQDQVSYLHAQLNQKHPGKKAIKIAGLATAFVACFAIPLGVGLACPPPSHFVNNNAGGN